MRQIISPLSGIRSPFGLRDGRFSPAVLFANNEPGVWYDPSDLSTLFQDTAGTTPVTTPGQTVALMLDKSKGLTLGPELVTNGGPFENTTGWTATNGATLSVVSSKLRITGNGSTTFPKAETTVSTVAGRTYLISVPFVRVSGPGPTVYLNLKNPTGEVTFASSTASSGTFVLRVAAGGSTLGVVVVGQSANDVVDIDNISVKELPGFHAVQATAAARPTYGIVPAGGRRNLLTFTEQFDNAAWTKSSGFVVTPNATAAPTGGLSADLITVTSPAFASAVQQSYSPAAGAHTATVYLKYNDAQWVQVFFGSTSFAGGQANFDLINGVIGATTVGAATMTSVGDGWYRCSLTRTATASGSTAVCATVPVSSGSANRFGSEVSGSYFIWGAQLEEGSTATPYQKVTTQFDVTEAGVESLGKLFFDGVDDIMISPSAIFYGSESSMILGAETFAAAGQRTVASDVSSIGLQFATSEIYGFVNNFTLGSGGVQRIQSYPNGRVVSWLRGQPQNSALLRVDGTGVASTTHNQADNVSRPLTVGGKVAGPFGKMDFYSLVHIARFIDETELSNTEAYVAGKTAGVDL